MLDLSIACAVLKQKVDQQNSMDTAENDSTAEHSLPNSSEGAEVQTCFACGFLC